MLNELNGKNYTVYSYDDHINYYVDGIVMGDCFGPARYNLIEGNFDKEDVLYRNLNSLDVNYLVVNTDVMAGEYEYYKRVFLEEYSKWKNIQLLFKYKNVFLFKLLTKDMPNS